MHAFSLIGKMINLVEFKEQFEISKILGGIKDYKIEKSLDHVQDGEEWYRIDLEFIAA